MEKSFQGPLQPSLGEIKIDFVGVVETNPEPETPMPMNFPDDDDFGFDDFPEPTPDLEDPDYVAYCDALDEAIQLRLAESLRAGETVPVGDDVCPW